MAHKVYEILGERAVINDGLENKLGIFEISDRFKTPMLDGSQALDFIEPLYGDVDKYIEEFAKGTQKKERVYLKNPILHFHRAVDLSKLVYLNVEHDRGHLLEGKLSSKSWEYLNDGNSDYYKYVSNLKKAGFEIYEPQANQA